MATQYVEDPETKQRIPFQWDNPNPPTSVDIESLLSATKGNQPKPESPFPSIPQVPNKSISGFIGNVGTNVADIAKGVATAVTHPIQTVKNVASGASDIMYGAAEKIAGAPPGSEEQAMFEQVSKPFVDAYKNPSKIPGMVFDYLYEKPVDAAMLVSGGAGLVGKAAKMGGLAKTARVLETTAKVTDPLFLPTKVVKPVIGAVGKVAKETTGALTGGGPGFIEEMKLGGAAADKVMRGNVTGEQVVKHAKDAFKSMYNMMRDEYLVKLDKIRVNPKALKSVQDDLVNTLKTISDDDHFGVGVSIHPVTGEPIINFRTGASPYGGTGSTITEHQRAVRNAIKDVIQWQDNSAKGLDVLKKRLGDFVDQTGQRTPARSFITQLRNNLSDGLKNAIPEYEAMTKPYHDSINLLKDIESNLMIRKEGMSGRITADQTLRRLSSSLREGFEMRKTLLRTLGNKSGMDIPGEVAGYIATQWIPRGIIGKGLAAGNIYALHFLNPKLWPILAASSPRIVGEFLSAYGKARKLAEPVTKVISKVAKNATKPEVLAPVSLAGRIRPPATHYEGEPMKPETPIDPWNYEGD